jgi:Chaperone of endosialidase
MILRAKVSLLLSLAVLAFGFIAVPECANAQTTGVNTPSSSSTPLYLGTQGNTYMSILTNGGVQIGTSTLANIDPSLSATNLGGYSFVSSTSLLSFGNALTSPNAGWIQSHNSSSAALPLVLNPSGGNVGIGMPNPAWKLEVSGNNSTTPASATITAQGYQSSIAVLNQAQSMNWYFGVNDANSNELYIGTGYSAQQGIAPTIAVTTGGNAGIGVTSPGASTKLQVAGMGLFTGGTVNPGDGTPAGVEVGYNGGGFVQAVQTGVAWQNLSLQPGGGNVLVGTAGNGAGTVTANAYYHASDARLKTDIKPVDHALDKLLALKGVTFNWKNGGRPDMGVTAQNVESVFPNTVSKGTDGMMSVNYDSLIGPMIEAIRELNARNEGLAARNDKLETEITDLKKLVNARAIAP